MLDIALDAVSCAPIGGPWGDAGPFVTIVPDVRGYVDFLVARAYGAMLPDAIAVPAGQLLL